MRTEFILTKVRPIKKLFIIEPSDYESFALVFTSIQTEIDIIQNLIFVNDDDLWSLANKEFVKRSDPDIILNLSELDDEALSMHFDIFSAKPITDQYKIARFGTTAFSFSNLPTFYNKFDNSKDTFTVLSASTLENTAESLLACINYGLLTRETENLLGGSIFKKMKASYLMEKEEIFSSIFENDKKYIQLTTFMGGFGGFGQGSSIYEINYNKENLFNDNKKYFFISERNDFKAISFFWNIRSYYPYANIAWIPGELISDLIPLVNNESIFVCFNQEMGKMIQEQFISNEIIRPTRLFFSGRNERWTCNDHTQTVSIVGDEIIIQHPAEKSFGSMGAFVLETRGLKEFANPKRRSIGNLFLPGRHDHAMFSERFQRISELGLSKYVLQVSPLRAEDVTESIVLPTINEVIQHLFKDAGFNIKKTPKSSILEQTVILLGGMSELSIISDKNVFHLLVALTPKIRTEKVVKKILEDTTDKDISANILEIIAEIREKGAVNFPSVTLTLDEIVAKTSLPGNERKKLFPVLQRLYDQRIFLRGKYFECSSCNSKLWIQLDDIKRVNYCIECSNLINIPVFFHTNQASDYFRLNQLIVRAVDQGQLSTLLLLNLFVQQNTRFLEYQSNLEIRIGADLVTDIDLFIKIGKRIGIAECKSSGGFDEKQITELIKISSALKCDFIAFSSLIALDSQEVKDLVNSLNEKSLDIPAFIFTSEVLFKPTSNLLQKYFELWRSETFKVGPILVN